LRAIYPWRGENSSFSTNVQFFLAATTPAANTVAATPVVQRITESDRQLRTTMNDQHEELDISGVKIAIIDDAKTIRMMMSHTLKGMGCEVECAEDGYKALGMLRRFKPDLIFLDITMPELDGYQTCTLIRNAEDTRNTPVVMLSSSDGIFDIAKGQARGATAHVTKIPPERVLRQLIHKHTRKRKAA
jgi:twitching motility two-component system response regulator PilG